MTGGFNTTVRGIYIDVIATLNKFSINKKTTYYRKDFENYLKSIGLNDQYRDNTGQETPISNGFVVSFDLDEKISDKDEVLVALLATGLWEYQHWVSQSWDEKDLVIRNNFNNKKFLSKKIENNLRNEWQDKLVLDDKFSIFPVTCERSNSFFHTTVTQTGGDIIDYKQKYIKYKSKYLQLKQQD